jgi:hypothetical protein
MEREHAESKRLENVFALRADLENLVLELEKLKPAGQPDPPRDGGIQCNHCGCSILLFNSYSGTEVRVPSAGNTFAFLLLSKVKTVPRPPRKAPANRARPTWSYKINLL